MHKRHRVTRSTRAVAIFLISFGVSAAFRAYAQPPAPEPLPAPLPRPTSPAPAAPRAPANVPPPNTAAPAGVLPGNNRPANPREEGRPIAPPGRPPGGGRPRPGSVFDPGAAGPGINQSGEEPFLGGALDPRSGWPFVFLDHFQPRPERLERFWVVESRGCPQEMGTDPWPTLRVKHFNAHGELEQRDPNELLAQVAGRTTLVQVQGSLTTPDIALGGLLWTKAWLTYNGVFTPDMVIVAFDWPSQRVYRNDTRDINEKGRRAYVAGYHLARFLQAFPPESRVCLLGQSYGGRVVPSALHLLGGGALDSQDHDDPVRLPSLRPDLHLRAVVIAGASDHDWLAPGDRLDRALVASEAFLNLYNRKDEALRLYPFLLRSGHHRALGKIGLTNRDFDALGPLAARYAELDVHDLLKQEHSLLDAVANPEIAQRIAPYLWNFQPLPAPEQAETEDLQTRFTREGVNSRVRGLLGRFPLFGGSGN
jgi:hypothetical protein